MTEPLIFGKLMGLNRCWPPVRTRRLIYYSSCILFALLTTLAIVLNGADCLTDGQQPQTYTAGDTSRVFVVKSTKNTEKINGPDFRQVFDNLTIQVKENTPINSKLADIQAFDPADAQTENARIIYSIVDGADKHLFVLHVDRDKVELRNEVSFDYESPKRNYHLKIRAASIFMRYEVLVEIIVMDENDNDPQLEDFQIVFNNYRNNMPTGTIGRIPATDADINDQLRYRVVSNNEAEWILVNETTGDIQLNPWLNGTVPLRHILHVGVSDGLHEEARAQLVLTVNLVTETMLQNSVVLRLDGIGRDEFLTRKYETFLNSMARILSNKPGNIVVFNVEETVQPVNTNDLLYYRTYHGASIINSSLSVNIGFSVRKDDRDVESYFTSQYLEERIYLNRIGLMQAVGDVYVAPFQDNLCLNEPCQNYQECQATYTLDKAPKSFIATKNMLFRNIKVKPGYTCSCPPTFTGMKQKSECNLQINQCFSNPCLNGGTCHQHESGYTCECKPDFVGARCEFSFTNSSCQSITLPNLPPTNPMHSFAIAAPVEDKPTMCSGKSVCIDSNRLPASAKSNVISASSGFRCEGCQHSSWSTKLCQLKARSFSRGSYVTLPSLKRRHRFHIQLKFATVETDALLFYNGRFSDKHDFVALEIVDSYLKFSYSLGGTIHTVTLPSISVSSGNWRKVAIDYRDRNVTLLVDDCDPVLDEILSRLPSGSLKRCSNTTYNSGDQLDQHRTLDLSSPMQIGSLPPNQPSDSALQFSQKGFVGCISDIYIDHQLVDLNQPLIIHNALPGCPEKPSFCQQQSCNGKPCKEAWGGAKCLCDEDHLGKSCEILISNEKVRKFSGNSYTTFSPIESTITPTWQVSLYFRTINPNGVLMKVSLDQEASSILLELFMGGLRLTHRSSNITFQRVNLDDGEWHFVEVVWLGNFAKLQVDHNKYLAAQNSDMGTIAGQVMRTITIGASATGGGQSRYSSSSMDQSSNTAPETGGDFSSSHVMSTPAQDDYSNLFPTSYSNSSSSPSFVGCIYGVNITDNTDLWITTGDERNVERGCQVPDACESNSCPPNSQCVKRGMNQHSCVCKPGFLGDQCLPVCELNPCQGENSRCYPLAGSNPTANGNNEQASLVEGLPQAMENLYRCECEPHRSGKNCEHQLSPSCPAILRASSVASGNASYCAPCDCDDSKGLDGDCDKRTGQCFCKPAHYQPAGSDTCFPCDCYSTGSLGTACNSTTGQCKCRSGVVGRRCDSCASSYAEVTLRGCEVIDDICPKTFSDGIWWDRTELNKRAEQQCPPSTSSGKAIRFCHKTEGWQKPNMFGCISNTFYELHKYSQFFEENKFSLKPSSAAEIAAELRFALNQTISNPALQLYGSDILLSFRLIHHLIQHETRQAGGLNLTHRQDRYYIRNIVESINYILDPAYKDSWHEIETKSPHGGAEHLLRLMDNYGRVLIESRTNVNTQPFEVNTKYFTFGMDILSSDNAWDSSKANTIGVGQHPSGTYPPYATDNLNPPVVHNIDPTSLEGGSIIVDQSMGREQQALAVPKYEMDYDSDLGPDFDDITKALIPLKTLKIKTIQELLPSTYYHTKSKRARRADDLIIPEPVHKHHSLQQPAMVVYSIYRSLGPLLPAHSDTTVQHRFGQTATANAPVVWLTMRAANSSDFINRNIQPKINYVLKMVEPMGKTRPQCAVWEFSPTFLHAPLTSNKSSSSYSAKQTGRFSTKGCEVKGIHPNHRLRFKYDYINCSCDHLGAVTVLMDTANYEYLTSEDTNTKDTALIVGLVSSLVILMSMLFILTCVRGHNIKSNSNSINKNLVFILIIIELLMLYSIGSRSSLNQREYQCKLVAIFLHYFSISLFFWLLVNAMHFYRMLTELRDINHGPMRFYHVLGYAVPAFFVSIAIGLRIEQFGNYLFCWLSIHESIIWSMFGPICLAASVTVALFMLVLLCPGRSKSVASSAQEEEETGGGGDGSSDTADSLLKNHTLINIIKSALIGFYWLMAVYVVNEALQDHLASLFPAITIIKSLVLFGLLCVLDKQIRYSLYISWLRLRGQKVPFMMDEQMNAYASSQWMAPGMMLGAGGVGGSGDPMAAGLYGPGSKHYMTNAGYAGYAGHHHHQVMTPGFQSSCTDIFQADALALSVASTTSRSSATGTSSSAYQYQSNRNKVAGGIVDQSGYGRTTSGGRRGHHGRRHKKSHRHHKHHHHHHRHHHTRSHHHHHQEEDYGHYTGGGGRRHTSSRHHGSQHDDRSQANTTSEKIIAQNELASSHSSDGDDLSTLPKRRAAPSGSRKRSPELNVAGDSRPTNLVKEEDAKEEKQEHQQQVSAEASTSAQAAATTAE